MATKKITKTKKNYKDKKKLQGNLDEAANLAGLEVKDVEEVTDPIEKVIDETIEIEDKVDTLEANIEEGYEPTQDDIESNDSYQEEEEYEPTQEELALLKKQIASVSKNLKFSISSHKVILQKKLAELRDRLDKL